MSEEAPARAIRTVHVAVAIITFRRPDGVMRLLTHLQRQTRAPERPFELTIIIVDNDSETSAEVVARRFATSEAFNVRYVSEPRQGIPIARNSALDAIPEGADFVCFIDDDEWPSERWLDALLEQQASGGAACIYGPVEPVYPAQAPTWFIKSRVFERQRFPNGASLSFAASNNVMIATEFLNRTRLRFDERMRFTGGSDYLFFRQAIELGMSVRWADNALVYDAIPRNRMTWPWVLRRQYRIGNTFAISERIIGRPGLLWWRLVVGIMRTGLGVAMLPLLIVSPYYGMRGVRHALRGAGMVVGLVGHRLEEYAPDALALDRSPESGIRLRTSA